MLMVSSIRFTILVKFDCRFGKIKNVVHTAGFTGTHSMSSKTLSTQSGTDDMQHLQNVPVKFGGF